MMMMLIEEEDPLYLFLDTETTNLPIKVCDLIPDSCEHFPFDSYKDSRLLEIAWVLQHSISKEILEMDNFLVYPSCELSKPPFDPGLLEECISQGKEIKYVLDKLSYIMTNYNVILVCHNVYFDKSILAHEFALNGMVDAYNQWNDLPSICTMRESKKYYNNRWPKLQRLYNDLGLPPVIQTHRAMDDVEMLIQCFNKMKEKNWI